MAVEYNRKIDWQINSNVKVELVKRYVVSEGSALQAEP